MNWGNIAYHHIQEHLEETRRKDGKVSFPRIVLFEEQNLKFKIKLVAFDQIGLRLEYIHITSDEEFSDSQVIMRKLEEQAEQIQTKITYLLENFKLIELDKMNRRVQLRSYPPYDTEDGKYFYEIIIENANEVYFQRFAYSYEHKRYEKVVSDFTREAFIRLINDLATTLV